MHKELKKAIILWLLENENTWARLHSCTDAFREYIFSASGNYLIGGEDVSNFIDQADRLLYNNEKL